MAKELDVLGCSLDEAGLSAQRARYAEVAAHVKSAAREALSLEVRLDSDLDEAVLHTLIEVERGCCPFFRLAYDPSARVFRVGVAEPEQAPALDAIAHALATG